MKNKIWEFKNKSISLQAKLKTCKDMDDFIDREEYYIAAIGDKFPCDDDMDIEAYFEAANKAIDKTLQAYTKNGKVLIEDWDMFDQDLYTNASNELDKL